MQCKEYFDANSELFKEEYDEETRIPFPPAKPSPRGEGGERSEPDRVLAG